MTRRLRALRSWLRWVAAGRPTDEPVVIRQGRVIVCRHGFALVTGWHWDSWHQTATIDADVLLDRYSARYPQERVDHLDGCPACTNLVTL